MRKILKIACAHKWNIIHENFVPRAEEVARQSVRQLKIFISRLESIRFGGGCCLLSKPTGNVDAGETSCRSNTIYDYKIVF